MYGVLACIWPLGQPVEMSMLDLFLVAILLLWSAASLLFLFPIPRVRRRLVRLNQSRIFARWGLFTSKDSALRPGTFEFDYRDRDRDGNVSAWQSGPRGYAWRWYAFLWLPQRATALAIQNLGREIKTHLHQDPPNVEAATQVGQIVLADLRSRNPPSPGMVRELRAVRRFASDPEIEEHVMTFSDLPDDSGK